MVECDLAKVEVAGSNPVSRSKKFLRCDSVPDAVFPSHNRWPFALFESAPSTKLKCLTPSI